LDLINHENIANAYKSLVKAQLELLPFINPKQDMDWNIPGVPGAVVEYHNGILKYTIPEIPPHSKDKGPVDKAISEYWIGMMSYALHKAKIKTPSSNSKKLCLIKIHHRLAAPWDTDNRTIKHIHDGLRYLRLIPDDSSKYLSYMVTGEYGCPKEKTEIFLVDYDLVNQKFVEIGLY
jgi:hypothetical protein